MKNISKVTIKKIIFLMISFIKDINIKEKFKFIIILILAITLNSCFMFKNAEDTRTTKDLEFKVSLFLAGQSNMEGNVPDDLYDYILNIIITQNENTLQSNLEATMKD